MTNCPRAQLVIHILDLRTNFKCRPADRSSSTSYFGVLWPGTALIERHVEVDKTDYQKRCRATALQSVGPKVKGKLQVESAPA